MSKGYVYILSNQSMPGIFKIGRTTRNVPFRASELFKTGVPTPFREELSVFSPDCSELERMVHSELAAYRVSPDREFFAVSIHQAIWTVEDGHATQLKDLVAEFLPDHIIVSADMSLSEERAAHIAACTDTHPFIVGSVLNDLTPDEFAPAIARYHARIASMTEKKGGSSDA